MTESGSESDQDAEDEKESDKGEESNAESDKGRESAVGNEEEDDSADSASGDAHEKSDGEESSSYTFSFEDDSISVRAEISRNSVFSQDENRVDKTEIHLEGDTEENDLFSDLSENYSGEVRTIDLSFCTEDGEEAEQIKGSTELTMTLPKTGDHTVINQVERRWLCGD